MAVLIPERRWRRWRWGLVSLVAAVGLHGRAAEIILCADIPCDLGGTPIETQWYQTIRTAGTGSFTIDSSLLALGNNVKIDALHLLSADEFLFSTDNPFVAGADTFDPRDVVRCVRSCPTTCPTPESYTYTFSMYQCGGPDAGCPGGINGLDLPREANVDAIALDSSGSLLLSLDAPLTLDFGGTPVTFEASDVLKVVGSAILQTPVFSGASVGLGSATNAVGLHVDAVNGDLFLVFSTPTTSGTEEFRPWTVERYANGALSRYWEEPTFPGNGGINALSFPTEPSSVDPGAVPDGNVVPGPPLKVYKVAVGDIKIDWSPSCGAGADYAVYEGVMGAWETYGAVATSPPCSTSGATELTTTPLAGDRFYLAVPHDAELEGSYGVDSTGKQRPAAAAACRPVQMASGCP